MKIGELAREAGIRPSAVRYYERVGLLPAPLRRNGRREYGPDALAHLAVVQFARHSGCTIAETRRLVRGFPTDLPASARWQRLAQTKLVEIDVLIARATAMRELLKRISRCRCGALVECGRHLVRQRAPLIPPAPKVLGGLRGP